MLSKTPLVALALVLTLPALATAHVTKTVDGGAITIKSGWIEEPASSGARNHVFFAIWHTASGEGVTGLADDMNASVSYLGETKALEMEESDEEPGNYTAAILPTKPGLYVVHLAVTIDGKAIKEDFNIEDVKDGSDEAFPGEGSGGDLTARVAALEQDVAALKEKVKAQSQTPSTPIQQSPAKGVPAIGVVAALATLGAVALALGTLRRR